MLLLENGLLENGLLENGLLENGLLLEHDRLQHHGFARNHFKRRRLACHYFERFRTNRAVVGYGDIDDDVLNFDRTLSVGGVCERGLGLLSVGRFLARRGCRRRPRGCVAVMERRSRTR